MPRKRSTKKGKPRAAKKKTAKATNPEWDFVEQRFSNMNVDFNELVSMMAD